MRVARRIVGHLLFVLLSLLPVRAIAADDAPPEKGGHRPLRGLVEAVSDVGNRFGRALEELVRDLFLDPSGVEDVKSWPARAQIKAPSFQSGPAPVAKVRVLRGGYTVFGTPSFSEIRSSPVEVDSRGRFKIALPHGRYSLCVLMGNASVCFPDFRFGPSAAFPSTLRLEGRPLVLQVVDGRGRPVSGAEVEAGFQGTRVRIQSVDPSNTLTTDRAGKVTIPLTPCGAGRVYVNLACEAVGQADVVVAAGSKPMGTKITVKAGRLTATLPPALADGGDVGRYLVVNSQGYERKHRVPKRGEVSIWLPPGRWLLSSAGCRTETVLVSAGKDMHLRFMPVIARVKRAPAK